MKPSLPKRPTSKQAFGDPQAGRQQEKSQKRQPQHAAGEICFEITIVRGRIIKPGSLLNCLRDSRPRTCDNHPQPAGFCTILP